MVDLVMLRDNVLIEPEEAENKTAGGIMLPDSDKEKSTKGTVRAVGPGGANDQGKIIPLSIKPGQKVLYRKWAGFEVKHKDTQYCIMRESEVLAICEG